MRVLWTCSGLTPYLKLGGCAAVLLKPMSCINSVVDAVVVQTSWPRPRISGVADEGSGVAEGQMNGMTAHHSLTAGPARGWPVRYGESLRAMKSCNLVSTRWRLRPAVGDGYQRRWLSLTVRSLQAARAG